MVLQMTNNENKNFKKSKLGAMPEDAVRSNIKTACKADRDYCYYSRVLNKPFDSIEELRAAEDDFYLQLKAKEDKAAAKKADAKKVEDAFKAMNTARKEYKTKLTQLTKEYAESLDNLKKAYEFGKKDIQSKLATAEETYKVALKEFTDKHDSYHLTLKDGDFETTISSHNSGKKVDADLVSIFDMLFNW
jgi:hypothetical protein